MAYYASSYFLYLIEWMNIRYGRPPSVLLKKFLVTTLVNPYKPIAANDNRPLP